MRGQSGNAFGNGADHIHRIRYAICAELDRLGSRFLKTIQVCFALFEFPQRRYSMDSQMLMFV